MNENAVAAIDLAADLNHLGGFISPSQESCSLLVFSLLAGSLVAPFWKMTRWEARNVINIREIENFLFLETGMS